MPSALRATGGLSVKVKPHVVNIVYQVDEPGPSGFGNFFGGFTRAAHVGTVGVKLDLFNLFGGQCANVNQRLEAVKRSVSQHCFFHVCFPFWPVACRVVLALCCAAVDGVDCSTLLCRCQAILRKFFEFGETAQQRAVAFGIWHNGVPNVVDCCRRGRCHIRRAASAADVSGRGRAAWACPAY